MIRSRLAPASVRRRLRGLGSPAALGRPLTGTPSLGRDLAIVDPLLVARLVAEALLSRLHRSGPGGAGDEAGGEKRDGQNPSIHSGSLCGGEPPVFPLFTPRTPFLSKNPPFRGLTVE